MSAPGGTPLAPGRAMENDAFISLLIKLHDSLDRVAGLLAANRPDLARALRQRSRWIPRPEEIARGARSARKIRSFVPLLYQALSEGAVDAREFDRVMIRQERAARELRQRE